MEEDILNYSPTAMFRGTPCTSKLYFPPPYSFFLLYILYVYTVFISNFFKHSFFPFSSFSILPQLLLSSPLSNVHTATHKAPSCPPPSSQHYPLSNVHTATHNATTCPPPSSQHFPLSNVHTATHNAPTIAPLPPHNIFLSLIPLISSTFRAPNIIPYDLGQDLLNLEFIVPNQLSKMMSSSIIKCLGGAPVYTLQPGIQVTKTT